MATESLSLIHATRFTRVTPTDRARSLVRRQNLDNWKSSRRKRQEDVIERLTEVKKMEEDVGGSRRRAKTFGEMMQDRGG